MMSKLSKLFQKRWKPYIQCLFKEQACIPSEPLKIAVKSCWTMLAMVSSIDGPFIYPYDEYGVEVVCYTTEKKRLSFLVEPDGSWSYCSVQNLSEERHFDKHPAGPLTPDDED